MSKTLFANSKTAIAFAGITIIGAVVMIGPQDGGGVLDRAIDTYGMQRETIVEEARSVSEERREDVTLAPLDPDSGWGGTPAPVFGEFAPEVDPGEPPVAAQPSQGPPADTRGPTPGIRIGGPVVAHSPGILVPREQAEQAVPVITSRALMVEPE